MYGRLVMNRLPSIGIPVMNDLMSDLAQKRKQNVHRTVMYDMTNGDVTPRWIGSTTLLLQ